MFETAVLPKPFQILWNTPNRTTVKILTMSSNRTWMFSFLRNRAISKRTCPALKDTQSPPSNNNTRAWNCRQPICWTMPKNCEFRAYCFVDWWVLQYDRGYLRSVMVCAKSSILLCWEKGSNFAFQSWPLVSHWPCAWSLFWTANLPFMHRMAGLVCFFMQPIVPIPVLPTEGIALSSRTTLSSAPPKFQLSSW